MTDSTERILVVVPTWVGDAAMATPTLRAIRRRFPTAHIAWLGGPAALATLAGLPWADELLGDPSKGRGLRGLLRGARLLRDGRFDLAVLLSNTFRAALLCRMGRIRSRVGYDRDGRGFLLTDRLEVPRDEHGRFAVIAALEYYLGMARHLGCDTTDHTMHLAVDPADGAAADAMLDEAGVGDDELIVLINPGASFGASKLWMPDRFAAVADALVETHGARIIINAAPSERPIAAAVADAMRHRPAINFAHRDNTLGLLKALTARAGLMITGDTGPRHIAAALGCAVVTLFGPTNPFWTTLPFIRERIVRVEATCGPCQQKTCPLKPGASHHLCMKMITTEMVLAAAEQLLEEAKGGAG
ncbi:MAG: lipopolysaccharide heptosyltransferase II [Planctomycetes bacterium]|nr:lipopolysaccharide heptosyltransferase II [Planctomycetota bacterium]